MKKFNQNISLERAFSIIKKPMMTEKSTNLNQYNQYSFIVIKECNSSEIKQAVEKIFKVKIDGGVGLLNFQIRQIAYKLGFSSFIYVLPVMLLRIISRGMPLFFLKKILDVNLFSFSLTSLNFI